MKLLLAMAVVSLFLSRSLPSNGSICHNFQCLNNDLEPLLDHIFRLLYGIIRSVKAIQVTHTHTDAFDILIQMDVHSGILTSGKKEWKSNPFISDKAEIGHLAFNTSTDLWVGNAVPCTINFSCFLPYSCRVLHVIGRYDEADVYRSLPT
jgi:hypothetical protein